MFSSSRPIVTCAGRQLPLYLSVSLEVKPTTGCGLAIPATSLCSVFMPIREEILLNKAIECALAGKKTPYHLAERTAGRRLCHDYGIPRKHQPLPDESEVRLRMEGTNNPVSLYVKRVRVSCAKKWLPAKKFVSRCQQICCFKQLLEELNRYE